MNQTTTMFPDATIWNLSKNILKAGELDGALHLLGPDAEIPAAPAAMERIVYMAHGMVTAAVGSAHYILKCDETLHVLADRSLALRNHTNAPAKVLVVTLPPKKEPVSSLVFPQ